MLENEYKKYEDGAWLIANAKSHEVIDSGGPMVLHILVFDDFVPGSSEHIVVNDGQQKTIFRIRELRPIKTFKYFDSIFDDFTFAEV